MIDFRQKLWTKLYYNTRLSNSREDSQRVANEAVDDFDKMFEDSTQTLKQAFEKCGHDWMDLDYKIMQCVKCKDILDYSTD